MFGAGVGSKPFPGSPVERDAPMLGQLLEKNLLKKKQDDPSGLMDALSTFPPLRAAARLFGRSSAAPCQLPTPVSSPLTYPAADHSYMFPPHSHAPAFQPQPIPASSMSSNSISTYPSFSSRPPSALSSHAYTASRPASAMNHAAGVSSQLDSISPHTQ
ncbi:uncharacterized protein FIBRA_04153 [Fibroporia radiculosa]|uniref:Uncharacterized protein n=1 Tax=Fibroporia radiculosa TaxID=599839 RepID=J4IA06_9APHY|nr:uncharacterized protein FIBRA_04153 [Fibroporia radiculosa]CCM02076.1 predicted protein [Fibroporia radiculosa]